MAETRSLRLSLPQWGAGTDAPSRADFNEGFLNLENKAAKFGHGTFALRPAAGAANAGMIYMVVGDANLRRNGVLWYCDGSTWTAVGQVAYGQLSVASDAAGTIPLYVVGASGQTADLARFVDFGGAIKFAIAADGSLTVASATTGNLTVNGTLVNNGALTQVGAATFQAAVTMNSTLVVSQLKSSANRADGTPKTSIKSDGTANIDGLIPPGSMMMTAVTVAPTGWLLCQGQVLTRTTYQDLFNAIGTVFNTGGETTAQFRLPDARSAVLRGLGAAEAFGAPVGSDTRTLAVGDLPAHTHSMDHDHAAGTTTTDGAHTHTMNHDHPQATSSSVLDHTHTMNHDHAAFNTSDDGSHTHSQSVWNSSGSFNLFKGTINAGEAALTGAGGTHHHTVDIPNYTGSTGAGGAHSHTVDIPAYTGNTGSGGGHSHTFDVAAYVGSTGSVGGGNPINIVPRYLGVNVMIKT